jgi:hypothetical protein
MPMPLEGGVGQERVAAAPRVGKRDVSAAARAVRESGVTAGALAGMAEAEVDATSFPKAPRARDENHLQPDLPAPAGRKGGNRKVPVKQFRDEHCEAAAAQGKAAYPCQAFCEMFAAEAERSGAARHFAHAPGEKAYVDWAGDAAWLTDRVTGRRTKACLLVFGPAVLGALLGRRPRRHAPAVLARRPHAALEDFGGVPRILVPDNCATAVGRGPDRATCLNAGHGRFAGHYGTAVLPARVRAPRDKGLAESTVNPAGQRAVAPSSELTSCTLDEFNEYCAERVGWLNARPFSDREGSRDEAFAEGAEHLPPLPAERFEPCERGRREVPPGHRVRVDYMHYSVPCQLVGRTVDVRLAGGGVDVLDGGEAVASHRRPCGRKGQYSTDPAHMPASHREAGSPWSAERFESWAGRAGPLTGEAVRRVLAGRPAAGRPFVACGNMPGLSKSCSPQLPGEACARANELGALPSYTGLKNAVLAIRAPPAPSPSPARDGAKTAGRTRGAEAHRGDGDGGDGDAD